MLAVILLMQILSIFWPLDHWSNCSPLWSCVPMSIKKAQNKQAKKISKPTKKKPQDKTKQNNKQQKVKQTKIPKKLQKIQTQQKQTNKNNNKKSHTKLSGIQMLCFIAWMLQVGNTSGCKWVYWCEKHSILPVTHCRHKWWQLVLKASNNILDKWSFKCYFFALLRRCLSLTFFFPFFFGQSLFFLTWKVGFNKKH